MACILLHIFILLYRQKVEPLKDCFILTYFSDPNCKTVKIVELREEITMINIHTKNTWLARMIK